MNKLIKISVILSTLMVTLNAATFTNPLGSAFKSTDNGGTLPAIDAYKDGIGVIVLDNQGTGFKIDNSAMNTLVYKYGETAKNNNVQLDVAVLNDIAATNKDKTMAGNLTNIVSGPIASSSLNVNGTVCNDNNSLTVNDIYTNGICAGSLIVAANNTCQGGFDTIFGFTYNCNDLNLGSLSTGWLSAKQASDLRFENNNLTNIDNLSNLTLIGYVYLSNNHLTNVNGFKNVATISGGTLDLTKNPELQDISGLSKMVSINYAYIYLDIRDYPVKMDKNSPLCLETNPYGTLYFYYGSGGLKSQICNQ